MDSVRQAEACPDVPADGEVLTLARAKHKTVELDAARKWLQEDVEAAQRRERQAVIASLKDEVVGLISSDPDLGLLDAIEFVTSDFVDRVTDRNLGSRPVAVGKILDLMKLRGEGQVADEAVTSGYGVRRWDADRFHIDWRRDRVLWAIRAAVADPDHQEVAATFDLALLKQRPTAHLAAERKRQQGLRRRVTGNNSPSWQL